VGVVNFLVIGVAIVIAVLWLLDFLSLVFGYPRLAKRYSMVGVALWIFVGLFWAYVLWQIVTGDA
jgi:hypothetical protein